MPGTNIWGPLFVVLALIAGVLVLKVLIDVWKKYLFYVDMAEKTKSDKPSWVIPTVLTIGAIGAMIAVGTISWNMVVGITTNSSSYENPAEIEAKKKIQQSKMPTTEEMDKAKESLKSRAETKQHESALGSFDKAMQEEAEKIRQRNAKQEKEN